MDKRIATGKGDMMGGDAVYELKLVRAWLVQVYAPSSQQVTAPADGCRSMPLLSREIVDFCHSATVRPCQLQGQIAMFTPSWGPVLALAPEILSLSMA
jgi:hypothetical protein